MPEPLLHLVFSPPGLSGLLSRVGAGDCVVLMPGSTEVLPELDWPSGVKVFSLASRGQCLQIGFSIDYRGLVALTAEYSRVLSW